MPEYEPEDPLARSTARLSISKLDMENENPRLQVAELLRTENSGRRDSAVSLNSFDEDDETKMPPPPKGDKRRRSSVQSFSMGSKQPKREKVHKKKLKKSTSAPELELVPKAVGDKRLPFRNFRDFVLQVFTGKTKKHNWFQLSNASNVSSVVFCLVPGIPGEKLKEGVEETNSQFLTWDSVEEYPEFDFLRQNFDQLIRTSGPGSKDSIYSELQTITSIQLTKNERKQIMEKSKSTKITINDLLLDADQLRNNNYPVEVPAQEADVWAETKQFEHEGSKIFAVDCEFCKCATGKVLTRISIINFQGEVVLDMLVKPAEEITDYVTQYSGITEAKLKDVTTTLKDVQEKVVSVVSADDILIGHSLESDLNVMKLKHTRIVDTALIYEHSRGPPSKPSLRWLAQKYLARTIQEGENNGTGHSSIEDAQACLDLVKLKILEGMCFGVNIGEVSLFHRLAKEAMPIHKNTDNTFNSLWINYSQYKDQESYMEPSENNVRYIYANNDDEVVQKFVAESPSKKFTVLSLRELEFFQGWANPPQHYTGITDKEHSISDLYRRTNQRLQQIHDALPENSIMVIHSISGSPQAMYKLQETRRNFQKKEREGEDLQALPSEEVWDTDKQQALLEATNAARDSVSFIGIKAQNSNSQVP